jgi:GntR family transcriptional regulator
MDSEEKRTIDKNLPVALYYQLAEIIKKQIGEHGLNPGDRLNTEKWYEETYGVSRVTVRKAFDYLISKGELSRIKNSSMVVAPKRYGREFNKLKSLFEELEASGISTYSEILESGMVKAEGIAAEKLRLKEGETVLYVSRLRYADSVPLADQRLYINYGLCRGLDPVRLKNESLFRILESEYGLLIAYADQKLRVANAGDRQCRLPGVDSGDSLLLMSRVSYTKDDIPAEYSETLYIPDRYEVSMRLYR